MYFAFKFTFYAHLGPLHDESVATSRAAETSAAGVHTDDISATRRLRIRVLQALLDELPQPPAVQTVVSNSYSYGEGQNWGYQNSKTLEPIVTKFGIIES